MDEEYNKKGYYTHRGLLGPGAPLALRLQFRSPKGWRSEPFVLTVP